MGSDSSTRTFNADDRFLRQLERSDRLISPYRRELFQKLVQRIARFEIIEEVVDGNARSDEDQFASHDLRVAVNHFILHEHVQNSTGHAEFSRNVTTQSRLG